MVNPNSFPTGKERKTVVRKNEQEITSFQEAGRTKLLEEYSWLDSPLDRPNPDYFPGKPFLDSFKPVLPESVVSLKDYIETTLRKRKCKAIGIEFGGIGLDFFSGFTDGFFKRTIGVTLMDHRAKDIQSLGRRRLPTHRVLEGDIFSADTYLSLDTKLGGKKVDLIVERMARGLELVPVEPYTVSKILQIWYSLLREGGVMFVQTPVAFNNLLEVWATKIHEGFKDVLEIQHKNGKNDDSIFCSSFRLNKLPGAPDELPLLDPRSVRKIPKVDFPS